MVCDHCHYQIQENQTAWKLVQGTGKRGTKTGTVYISPIMERPYELHHECVLPFLQAEKDFYDLMYDKVSGQIYREHIDDIKAIAYSEAAEDMTKLCPECLSDKHDRDRPPEEYSCSDCGAGSLPICPDCGTVSDLAIEMFDEPEPAPKQRAYG